MVPIRIRQHPEMKSGEVLIGNVSPGVFPEMKRWKTKRQGVRALNDDGTIEAGKIPVFVSKKELEEAGIKFTT